MRLRFIFFISVGIFLFIYIYFFTFVLKNYYSNFCNENVKKRKLNAIQLSSFKRAKIKEKLY